MASENSISAKNICLNILTRVILSAAVALVTAFVLILLASCTSSTKLTKTIPAAIPGLFLVLFEISLFIVMLFYTISIISMKYGAKISKSIQERKSKVSLETKYTVGRCFRWISLLSLSTMVIIVLMGFRELITGTLADFFGLGFALFYIALVIWSSGRSLANFILAPRDSTVYHLEAFQRDHSEESLTAALTNYNRILGSTLPLRKLLSLSQFVTEAYKIGTKETLECVDIHIGEMIKSLKKNNVSEANRSLIELSDKADQVLLEHKEKLGFEEKYPLRMKMLEESRKILERVLPSLLALLLWVFIVVILQMIGVISISIPAPPLSS